jgi:hypothetical protein
MHDVRREKGRKLVVIEVGAKDRAKHSAMGQRTPVMSGEAETLSTTKAATPKWTETNAPPDLPVTEVRVRV